MTVKTMDTLLVKDLAEKLKLQGRREEADTLDALVEMLSLPGGYYTSDEVAKKIQRLARNHSRPGPKRGFSRYPGPGQGAHPQV